MGHERLRDLAFLSRHSDCGFVKEREMARLTSEMVQRFVLRLFFLKTARFVLCVHVPCKNHVISEIPLLGSPSLVLGSAK